MSTTKTTKKVTIERRGHFNDDAFFKDSRDEWDRAMKDAVHRWEDKTNQTHLTNTTRLSSAPTKETKNVYRQIRSSNMTSDDSQAVSCTEEDGKYKMVMDVKDFSPEHISVKCVDDTIVVEGNIEKKEGNSVSTQKFVRRFMLPSGVNMGAISSALSRDGVLTITAPQLELPASSSRITTQYSMPAHHGGETITSRIMDSPPRRVYTSFGPAAGKPSDQDRGPFNPTGGSNTTRYTTPNGRARVTETIVVDVPDRRGQGDDWKSFNSMVNKSQREMEDMMRDHTLDASKGVSSVPMSSGVVSVPVGVRSTKDVSRSGNNVTEREHQRWEDSPAPGVNRTNEVRSENTEMKDKDGNVVGCKFKREAESNASGEREETLPDGTKRKIFTKSYETKNSFKASNNNVKAM